MPSDHLLLSPPVMTPHFNLPSPIDTLLQKLLTMCLALPQQELLTTCLAGHKIDMDIATFTALACAPEAAPPTYANGFVQGWHFEFTSTRPGELKPLAGLKPATPRARLRGRVLAS